MVTAFIIIAGVPILILLAVFWVVLEHRLSRLGPFLIALGLIMGSAGLAGLNPLGFFVSPGGWLWLAGLSLLTALLLRGFCRALTHRSAND